MQQAPGDTPRWIRWIAELEPGGWVGVKPTYTEVNPTKNQPIHQPFVEHLHPISRGPQLKSWGVSTVPADLGWVYLSISWFYPLIPINCVYIYTVYIYWFYLPINHRYIMIYPPKGVNHLIPASATLLSNHPISIPW